MSSWTRDIGLGLAANVSEASAARFHDQEELRKKAVELRREGLSTRQIARDLGIRVSSTLNGWLLDVEPPDWTKRPRAKDDLREKARDMRLAGHTYPEIVEALGVSKSSVSLWVRDLPAPPREWRRWEHARQMGSAYWAVENARREAERERIKSEAAAQIGPLTERELLLVGAALYWAEGAKDKPWDRSERLSFINSDPRVITTYLAWLQVLGVTRDRCGYRLSIHESADLEQAHRFWSEVVGVPVDRFSKPTLKRHIPNTKRRNVGPDYHGCLIIDVAKSRLEYQRMDGMFRASAESASAILGTDEGRCVGGEAPDDL